MPLRLDVKKLLHTSTERVKAVDIHPTEPWVLSSLYSGKLMIHDYNTQSVVKSIEVSQLPVRCACFIARKQWILCGCDDTNLRVYHYSTLEKLKVFPAHSDYIRSVAIHPTSPYALSSSDDVTIKLWDWESGWKCLKTFENHIHYVMVVKWNPKDPHIFASGSLDRTIKIWGIQNTGAPGTTVKTPHFTLTGHKDGVNCIEYSASGDRPYLISGSDDHTVRVWDYQTKQCLQVLTGHTNNVTAVKLHPHLPIIMSGSEDGSLLIWHTATFQLERNLKAVQDGGRIWHFSGLKGSSTVAIGLDTGTAVIKLGREAPVVSMHGSKVLWAKGSDMYAANLKLLDDAVLNDGEPIDVSVKLLGNCEMFPQSISHHPSGRFIVVCDDNEYIIYTAQALRNKSFGGALNFVWSPDGSYAIRTPNGRIHLYQNFKEASSFYPSFTVEEMFGGNLIGLKTSEFIFFYDWQEHRLIRRIDVSPDYVWWSENGCYVVLACTNSFYILSHDKDAVLAAIAGGAQEDDEGVEIAFELITEINEKIETGLWISDLFVFITSDLHLQSFCAGRLDRVAYLDKQQYILGFIAEQNRLYLMDRESNITTYQLHLAFVEYQRYIASKDLEAADQLFPRIPQSMHNRVARFLEYQGYKEKALEITTDLDHKFELALWLDQLDVCRDLISSANASVSATISRWKRLGDKALEVGRFKLAITCFEQAKDLNGLFLIYLAAGDAENVQKIAALAETEGKTNLAFQCYLVLQDLPKCIQVLMAAKRYSEAALFALTYIPSKAEETFQVWKSDLTKSKATFAEEIASPNVSALFPGFDAALEADSLISSHRQKGPLNASCYTDPQEIAMLDIVEKVKSEGLDGLQQLLKSLAIPREDREAKDEELSNGVMNGNAEYENAAELVGEAEPAYSQPNELVKETVDEKEKRSSFEDMEKRLPASVGALHI